MILPFAALASADRWLLLKINRDWTSPLLDAAMPVITDLQKVPWFVYGVAPALLALWLWMGRKRALKVLIVAVLAMGASDFFSHVVLKPHVARLAFAGAAALVAYSRVYVGAHYPGDVLAGLALGIGIGWPWAVLMLGGAASVKKKRK